jgi:Transglycosylase-like domain
VRKLIVTVLALFLTSVPAALAASGPSQAQGDSLLRPTAHRLKAKVARSARHAHRRELKKQKKEKVAAKVPPQLEAIAQCESHGNPRSIGGGGLYRGKYQFDYGTWASVGGKGDPAKASEAEQDRRAAKLYEQNGSGQWPVCGA